MEASDADNLLEQFEEVSPDFDDDYSQNSSISGHFSTNTTSSNNQVQNGSAGNGNSKNPRKTSNIFKAVQNHFAASVAANNESNSANGRCRRLPRIGKSILQKKYIEEPCRINLGTIKGTKIEIA